MRVSFVGHASLLIECDDVRILTDPWWAGPCFGAQWWIYPEPRIELVEETKPNYIYLSHGHNDHFHPGTLTRFSRDTKILVAKELDLIPELQKMGFEVLALPDREAVELSPGVKVTIRPTINDDTLLVVSHGSEVCVNLNDAIHATPREVQDRFIAWLRKEFPVIDYVFCGYGTASHFPNCYRIPTKDNRKTAAIRQHHFNQSWARIIDGLKPKFAFPFAADVVLLEDDLFWANEPVHNSERPVDLLNRQGVPTATQALDIGPGFVVERGEVKQRVLRAPLSSEILAREFKAQIEKANYYPEVRPEEFGRVLPVLQRNLEVCEPFLTTYSGSYRFLIRIRNSAQGIEVSKSRGKIAAQIISDPRDQGKDYDLIFTSRMSYLQRSLDSKYGNEILFVGSGCLFEFPDVEAVSRRVHEEVRHIVRRHDACPPPRYGASSPLTYKSKELVKRLLGMKTPNLYDLYEWTVFTKD
jgi:hypothetical protein